MLTMNSARNIVPAIVMNNNEESEEPSSPPPLKVTLNLINYLDSHLTLSLLPYSPLHPCALYICFPYFLDPFSKPLFTVS